jgi:glycolate oxidase FAD binding subunit
MTVLEQLVDIVGEGEVRDGQAADAIDGVTPTHVVRPERIEQISELMTVASSNGLRVAPRGGGTGLGLGNVPRQVDLVIDLSRMDRVIEHSSGDLVAAMEPGARLGDIQGQLATAGQMLAIDGYAKGATIGGVIATNTSGPRRFRYGTVRDLLIGVTIVLPDGTVAKAGGKVVKNVAGYDLSKLMTGSLGTLGIIAKAIFRLHPLPPARRLLIAEVSTPQALVNVVQKTLHSSLVPTAIQLSWPSGGSGRVAILFESIEPSVVAQAAQASSLYGSDALVQVLEGGDVDTAWREFEQGEPAEPVEVKITCLPTAVGDVVSAARRAADAHGGDYRVAGEVGTGIVRLHMAEADAARLATLTQALRAAVRPGHVTVPRAPTAAKASIDVWGPVGDTESLMQRVKFRFDPDGILNPGRFVGGI